MKIASMGPNGVVLSQPETIADIVDHPEAVAPPAQETPAETTNQNKEKAKFSRIFDLIKHAQKNGKLKDSPKEKKKARALKKYLRQKDLHKDIQTIGTLFKSSA